MVRQSPAGALGWVEDTRPGPVEALIRFEDEFARWVLEGFPAEWEPFSDHTTGMSATWNAEVVHYNGVDPCPVCANPPRRGAVCLICSASTRNPRRVPMGPLSLDRVRAARRRIRGVRILVEAG
jgi:hypothetical protein